MVVGVSIDGSLLMGESLLLQAVKNRTKAKKIVRIILIILEKLNGQLIERILAFFVKTVYYTYGKKEDFGCFAVNKRKEKTAKMGGSELFCFRQI